jgi:hypothetical protein
MSNMRDNAGVKSSDFPLRIAAVCTMFLTLLCVFVQGRNTVPLLVAGQVLFGAATLVLVVLILARAFRKKDAA